MSSLMLRCLSIYTNSTPRTDLDRLYLALSAAGSLESDDGNKKRGLSK